MTQRIIRGIPLDEYRARVGDDVEPGGRPPAPDPLHLVQRFINTFNEELPDRDRLGTVATASDWLGSSRVLERSDALDEAGRITLVTVREALRDLARANVAAGVAPGSLRILEEASRRAQFVLRFGPNGSSLEATAPGIDGAVGRILARVHAAMADASWARLKACRQCDYAFYDRSKNRSGEWCAMSVCGNRVKNRSYRSRRG